VTTPARRSASRPYPRRAADFPSGLQRHRHLGRRQRVDRLVADGEKLALGELQIEVLSMPGRDNYAWETTVGEERARNVHVGSGVSEDEFVAMRERRDATLAAPLLLLPSILVNIRAGQFPPAESNGVRYLKVPVKLAS
jgi:hypothetical protein